MLLLLLTVTLQVVLSLYLTVTALHIPTGNGCNGSLVCIYNKLDVASKAYESDDIEKRMFGRHGGKKRSDIGENSYEPTQWKRTEQTDNTGATIEQLLNQMKDEDKQRTTTQRPITTVKENFSEISKRLQEMREKLDGIADLLSNENTTPTTTPTTAAPNTDSLEKLSAMLSNSSKDIPPPSKTEGSDSASTNEELDKDGALYKLVKELIEADKQAYSDLDHRLQVLETKPQS